MGGLKLPNMILAVNYYEILELSRTASQEEIKAAYKKMAAVVHPDKGGSAMLFRLVQEAYEVLSDPAKRKQHDSDLAGTSGGNRQSGSQQQQQSNTNYSEPNYIRVEDVYKRWKENRNRVAMPRSESYAAGGVRKMIRESAFVVIASSDQPKDVFNTKLGDVRQSFCGNCGFDAISGKVTRINPICLEDIFGKSGKIEQGQNISKCGKCATPAGVLRALRWTHDKFCSEEIRIDKGDYLYFDNGKFIGARKAFGQVLEGEARNEFGLKSLRVMDEYSGQIVTPKGWVYVMGHWKSNDLDKSRTGSLRNWRF